MTPAPAPTPIDLNNGTRLSVAKAAERLTQLRQSRRSCSPWTVICWIRRGIRLPDGTRLRLPGAKCGNAWTTTDEAIQWWIAEITAAHLAEPPKVPTARDERRAQMIGERAGQELAASGW
jgi:hypothetical protein